MKDEKQRDDALMLPVPMVLYWRGTPVTDLSRDELLAVVEHLASEVQILRDKWRESGDVVKYLMAGKAQSR